MWATCPTSASSGYHAEFEPVTALPSFHWLPLVRRFAVTIPEVKFTHSSNHTQNCRKYLYYLTRTKHNCTSAYIGYWSQRRKGQLSPA
jgi:hypothetical protein